MLPVLQQSLLCMITGFVAMSHCESAAVVKEVLLHSPENLNLTCERFLLS